MGWRERAAWGGVALFAASSAWLGLHLKNALKSPAPAAWNTYSQSANDHLYERLNTARPDASRIVAHQGGSVPAPGEPDRGPIARLDASYAHGLRLFELDLAWTADDELVVKHDWNAHDAVPTLKEFLAQSPERHATLAMVFDWLDRHPDAFIVTDCKKRSLEGCSRIRMERPDLVPQFIVQIYTFKDYELVRSQGFRHVVLTLYRALSHEPAERIVAFVAGHELFALTIPRDRVTDAALLAGVRQHATPIYVHTVNDQRLADELVASGAHGVYSDTLTSLGRTAAPSDGAGDTGR